MNNALRTAVLVVLCCFVSPFSVYADASLPTADIAGAKDPEDIGRFADSFILSASQVNFAEVRLPLAPLQADQDKRDAHNNIWFTPEQGQTLEGKHRRWVYLAPEGATPLEVVRNYQEKFTGTLLFACKEGECGGDPGRSSEGGGGEMSLAMFLWPAEQIAEEPFTTSHCAQTGRIQGQRYALMATADKQVYLSVLSYVLKGGTYCNALANRTIIVVDLVEPKAMGNKMVVVKAEEMAREINEKGSVALYGIYFDSDKASVKPASRETLDQIATFLREHPAQKVLVVGHTDNQGSFSYNMELSQRRAAAVVSALVKDYGVISTRLQSVGVSYAAPVAANSTEEGRALNRRVELVGDK